MPNRAMRIFSCTDVASNSLKLLSMVRGDSQSKNVVFTISSSKEK